MIQKQQQISYQQLVLYEQQLSKFDNKKMEPNIEQFLKEIINSNRNEQIYARLKGLYHINISNNQQALKNLNQAIQNDPNDIMAYLYRAQAYLNLNELEKGQQDCSTVMGLDYMIPLFYLIQGKIYLLQNQYQKAIKCFDTAIELDENCVNAYLLQGQLYFQLKKYQQAVQYLETAYQIDQENQLIVSYLIHTYYQLQQPQDVRRLAKELETFNNKHIFSPQDIQFINRTKQLKDKIQSKTTNETTPKGQTKQPPNQINIVNVFNFNYTATQDFSNQPKFDQYQNKQDSNQNQKKSTTPRKYANQQTQVCSPEQRINENDYLRYYYSSFNYRVVSILEFCDNVAQGYQVEIEKKWYAGLKKFTPFSDYVEPKDGVLINIIKIVFDLHWNAKNEQLIEKAKKIQQAIVYLAPNPRDRTQSIKNAIYKLIDTIQWNNPISIQNEINKKDNKVQEILKIEVSKQNLNNEWKQAWELGIYHSILVFDYLLKNGLMIAHPHQNVTFEDVIFRSIMDYR